MKFKNNFGFTLVELIVVITILVILAAIGFVSYSKYIPGVRDTNRITNIEEIGKGLNVKIISNGTLLMPSDYINIKVNSEIISYQGYLGDSGLDFISFDRKKGIDPQLGNFFTYYINKKRNNYQLLTFLEENKKSNNISLINKTFAENDYTSYFPYTYGEKLGLMTNEENTPVHEIQNYINNDIDLYSTNASDIFKMYTQNDQYYLYSGLTLAEKAKTLTNKGKYGPPDNCPEGFIPSRGDAGFNQEGFCIAKYEMTYNEEDSPITPDAPDFGSESWNGYDYDNDSDGIIESGETGYNKNISSRIDFPITHISYLQAKSACENIGDGYHLITNSEWMSVARQIEFEYENWTNQDSTNGFIPIGNSYTSDELLGCTENGGTTKYMYKTGDGTIEECSEKRKLILFNNQIIWDFVGNAWEWVDKNISTDIILNSTTADTEWSDSSIDNNERKLYGPIIGINFDNGMGRIINGNGILNNVILRSGTYSDNTNTGLYTISLGDNGGNYYSHTGFRCAK